MASRVRRGHPEAPDRDSTERSCHPNSGSKRQAADSLFQTRCPTCGAAIPDSAPDELLTLDDIKARFKVGRTKALELRREVRRLWPEAVLSHGRCVRVRASAVKRLWTSG